MAKKTNCIINGKKKYRLRAIIDDKEKNFYGDSKKDAEAKRDQFLNSLSNPSDPLYFSKLFDLWFHEILKPSVSKSSIMKYESIYRLRIKVAPFFYMPLSEVKTLDVQKYYNTVPAKRCKSLHLLLRHFVNYCVDEEYISKSFLDNVKLPLYEAPEEQLLFLSQYGTEKLVAMCNRDISSFIFVFALFTGLRRGEILALRHCDIKNNIIQVRYNLSTVKNIDTNTIIVSRSKLKTKSSSRDIPVMQNLRPLLKAHIIKEKEKTIKLGMSFSDTQLLFTNTTLSSVNTSYLQKRWAKVLKEIDEPYIKFHALRHTFCSMLAQNGVNLKTASVLMGHSNIQVTAKIYTHIDENSMMQAIESLNSKLI